MLSARLYVRSKLAFSTKRTVRVGERANEKGRSPTELRPRYLTVSIIGTVRHSAQFQEMSVGKANHR